MYSKFIILFSILVLIFSCTSDPVAEKEKKANQKQTLLSLATNGGAKADCVYCSNTQAFQGSCSCYSDIPVLTCAGLPAGLAKSNSYKISCSELTNLGFWVQTSPDSHSCGFQTCPPEAYRAAFTAEGQ